MKKYFAIAAAAAVVLASCAKIDTYKASENGGYQPIAFTNYTPRAITKAATGYYVDGTTNANLVSNTTFGVYAWSKTQTSTTPWTNGVYFAGSETPDFMVNVPVTFKGDDAGDSGSANVSATGLYSAGNPVRYWPSGDTPAGLSFYAYYPTAAVGDGLTMPANGLGATSFTVKTVAADQYDFMVAPVVADQWYGHTNSAYASGAEGTVDLTFKHTLTKVSFIFNTDNTDSNTEVKLTGAQLTGVFKTNVLTTSYTGTAVKTGTFAYDWAATATAADAFDVYINGTTPDSSTNAVPLSTTDTACGLADQFLMVPQTIAAGQQKITVTWTVKTGSGPAIENTKTIDLIDIKNGTSAIQWTKNLQVKYVITIGPKPIYFTASADAWTSEETGTISVN